jgi:CRISPR/Cas system-associated endonuclease Cas3-HD
MCWTPPCSRQKTKTSKTKHTTQYVLDDTVHKTKDEDKQNKNHNIICVGHHHTQEKRRRQKSNKKTTQYVVDDTLQKKKDEDKQNKKHNTICVGHHHTQNKRRRQTKQKTQHNMCWTPPYTRQKRKTNEPKNTTQYVL